VNSQAIRDQIEALIQQGWASAQALQTLLDWIPAQTDAGASTQALRDRIEQLIQAGGASVAELQALLDLVPDQGTGGGGPGEEEPV
jgi:siroheme synthase (precorrin-2 oxidase/ferrochelatase)